MASDVPSTVYRRPWIPDRIYRSIMKSMQNSFAEEISDIAAFRLHVLQHFYKYGRAVTLDAFKIKQYPVRLEESV